MRYRKLPIKKPPSQGWKGGSEKQGGSDAIFYSEYSTNSRIPQEDQFTYNADTARLKAEYWMLISQAIDILAVLDVSEHGATNE
jgi:hypothetical protein